MRIFERMLILTDRPEGDSQLMRFARHMALMGESQKIHLVEVIPDGPGITPVPVHLTVDGAFPLIPPPEELAERRQESIDRLSVLSREFFGPEADTLCQCDVLIGSPLMEPLRYAREEGIDTIILSRHFGDEHGRGEKALYPRRIAGRATCSVLVIPEDGETRAETLLVPVRDSECSANALNAAITIAGRTSAKVVPINVYPLRGGYGSIGTSPEEHLANLKELAIRECDSLLQKVNHAGVEVNSMCVPDQYREPTQVILDVLKDLPAQMIVIGARGRTGAAGILLGSITAQLIRQSPVPVLAIKRKGEYLGVIRSLLELVGGA